ISIGLSEKQNTLETTLTGTDGRFSFLDVSPAKYWLAARGHGFSQQGLDEHEGFFTGIAVGPNVSSQNFDPQNFVFRLRPDSSIVGLISDSENEPVAGAGIILFHTGLWGGENSTYEVQSVATDDEGRYHIGHLPAGSYQIAVVARPWYARYPN